MGSLQWQRENTPHGTFKRSGNEKPRWGSKKFSRWAPNERSTLLFAKISILLIESEGRSWTNLKRVMNGAGTNKNQMQNLKTRKTSFQNQLSHR